MILPADHLPLWLYLAEVELRGGGEPPPGWLVLVLVLAAGAVVLWLGLIIALGL